MSTGAEGTTGAPVVDVPMVDVPMVDVPMVDALAGRRVVVTGGSGFIGAHVVAALCRAGADVVTVDRRPAPSFRCHPAGDHPVTEVLGDLREPPWLMPR